MKRILSLLLASNALACVTLTGPEEPEEPPCFISVSRSADDRGKKGFRPVLDEIHPGHRLKSDSTSVTKQWTKREAQIERVMKATVGMYGDLEGIAGQSIQEIEKLQISS